MHVMMILTLKWQLCPSFSFHFACFVNHFSDNIKSLISHYEKEEKDDYQNVNKLEREKDWE